jgi:hypothetical protein
MPPRATVLQPSFLQARPVQRMLKSYRRWTWMRRALPDFIIIGAQKGGTTSLYRYLTEHPGIVSAYDKEVHFCDLSFHKGERWYRSHFCLRSHLQAIERRRGQRAITGEASPYYIFHPLAPQRVRAVVPDAKLIALLRNPIDRAYSHFIHSRRRAHEPLETFEEAIEAEPQRLAGEVEKIIASGTYRSRSHQRQSYLARGLYADQLVAWLALFPREQLLILQSEDFFAHTAQRYHDVLRFLGVSDWTLPAYRPANQRAYAPIAAATRRRLQDFFRPHNERLYDLLGRRFDWDDAPAA